MLNIYRIGEFAKKVNCSIQTLRYYDEINILKPNNVDIFTSYRYYDEENIRQYYIIILLKKIGFTLDGIKQYKDNLTDNVLINQRQKLLDEIFEKKEIIKKLDQVRNNIVDGKIVLDEFDYEINNIETRKYSKGDYYERK